MAGAADQKRSDRAALRGAAKERRKPGVPAAAASAGGARTRPLTAGYPVPVSHPTAGGLGDRGHHGGVPRAAAASPNPVRRVGAGSSTDHHPVPKKRRNTLDKNPAPKKAKDAKPGQGAICKKVLKSRLGSLSALEKCPTCGSVVAKGVLKKTNDDPDINQFNINPQDISIDTSKVLGQGGFGVVYLADFQATEVAVKVMLGDAKPKSSEMLEWKKEVEIMTHLRHPNILQLLGAVFHNDKLAIVTEYCSKGSLRKVVRDIARGSRLEVTWARKLDWLIQVARGMAFLHHKRIHHRDLKASNVFVSGDTMKIADFGLSNFRIPVTPSVGAVSPPPNRLSSPGPFNLEPRSSPKTPQNGDAGGPRFAPRPSYDRALSTPQQRDLGTSPSHISSRSSADASGTFAFVAPEVWGDRPFINASDVYSFGVMIIEIITTKVPYDDVDEEDEERWARRIRRGTSRPILPATVGGEHVPQTLIDKCKKCLAYSHKNRPEFKQVVKLLSKELQEGYTFENCPTPYESDDEDEDPPVQEYDGNDDTDSESPEQRAEEADGWERGEY